MVSGWSSFVALAVCSTVFVTICLIAAFATGALSAAEKSEMQGTLVRFYRAGSKRLGLATAEVEDQQAA